MLLGICGAAIAVAATLGIKAGIRMGTTSGRARDDVMMEKTWVAVFEDRKRKITLLEAPNGKVVRFSCTFTPDHLPLEIGRRYRSTNEFGDSFLLGLYIEARLVSAD